MKSHCGKLGGLSPSLSLLFLLPIVQSTYIVYTCVRSHVKFLESSWPEAIQVTPVSVFLCIVFSFEDN